MAQGQCLCGAVRFELQPPWRWFAHCHCSTCRRHHGSLFSTSLGVHVERFRWTAGTGHAADYAASPAFRRPFCRRCGSKLPAAPQREDTVNVPAGLVADIDGRPRTHIFTASKAACDVIADDLPQFEAYPPGAGREGPLPGRPGPPRQRLPADSLPESPRDVPAAPEGTIAGGCGCGAVAFEVAGSLGTLLHNHGPAARRSRGAAYATDAVVAAERVHWRTGTQRIETLSLDVPGSPAPEMPFRVSFCRDCGGLLPVRLDPEAAAAADRAGAGGRAAGDAARNGAPAGRVLIPAGAVASPLEASRAVHVFVATKAAWFDIADALPQYPFLPPPELI